MSSTYEPSRLEVWLTLTLGKTILSPYYRSFARRLNLRGGECVLDFGSGSGVCSRHIAKALDKGGQLDCVDISYGWNKVIQHTLRRYKNVRFHLGHITQLDLPESSFDVGLIHFVLHEIPHSERATILHSLARKLSPGGRLTLREPHDHGLTIGELRSFAEAAGLQIQTLQINRIATTTVLDGSFIKKEEK